MSFKKIRIKVVCKECGKDFFVPHWRVKRGAKYCSRNCAQRGIARRPVLWGDKIGAKNKKNKRPDLSLRNKQNPQKGDKNPAWKGGITPITKKIRRSRKYKEWKIAVFERDNYTCVFCGNNKGDKQAHHSKEFSIIINSLLPSQDLYNDAMICKELWDIENGITLCIPCHRGTFG